MKQLENLIKSVIVESYGEWLNSLSQEKADREYEKLQSVAWSAVIDWLTAKVGEDKLDRLEDEWNNAKLGDWIFEQVPFAKIRIREAVKRSIQNIYV